MYKMKWEKRKEEWFLDWKKKYTKKSEEIFWLVRERSAEAGGKLPVSAQSSNPK
jgi:hypothetical protein